MESTPEQRAIAAEIALHKPAIRADAAALEALLHPSFREVGRSGRHWTRAATIESLQVEPDSGPPIVEASGWTAELVADGIVLVTYASRDERGDAWRSSVWDVAGQVPRLRYHQATPMG